MRTQIGLALLLLAMATPARAQETDPRWTPWLGCWQLLNERVREGNPGGANAVAAAGERALGVTSDISVCVVPTPRPDAVTLTTRAANEPVLEQTLVADGRAQSTSEAGCTGTQHAEWSREGRRLFARAELTCAGQPVRTVSGIAAIAGDGTWIDVQAMESNGRANVRVRRFQRREGQRRAGAAWTVEDIKEASTKVSPAALEAALIESGARLSLDSRSLVELDEANVPDGVIDVLVALSYPDKFQIERRAEASLDLYSPGYAGAYSPGYPGAEWSGYWGYGLGYPYFSSFSSYSGYYDNYRDYFSPFSYGYYGLYGGYSGYYPGSAITIGVDPVPTQDSGNGRVINGVGYARVRPREAQPTDSGDGGRSGTASSGRATSDGYSQGGGSSTSSSAGGSSGGSSSGSSGGSSGGSDGGGGGGRTAQPR